jgi:asparagine synthase (glutamine-hydrolysing)
MSGIAGMVALDGQTVEAQPLAAMLQTMAHRGPDGCQTWRQVNVGLGHQMLLTTPESLLETLPLVDSSATWVLTADARIDNREALYAELESLRDRPCEKIPDSDFILAAYQQWGVQCPEYLLGAFAFALWDDQKQALFCARDHLGVKPFYYYYNAKKLFLFASEIKALLAVEEVPHQLNLVRLGEYLALAMHDQVATTYQDILRLPPAHSLLVTASNLRQWSYWSLDPEVELKLPSDEAYIQRFREIFTEAVRCRLRSAFPVGSHLSGGLDSSSITCVARQLLAETPDKPLHTFSNIFDEVTACDERPYIDAVVEQGGLTPHYVQADQFGPLSDTAAIWQYEDEALLGPSHSYPWHLNQSAQQAGVRVVLDGLDGDTTVSHGIFWLTELAEQGHWAGFFDEAEGLARNFDKDPQSILKRYAYPVLRQWGETGRWRSLLQATQAIHRHYGLSRQHLLWTYGFKPWLTALTRPLRSQPVSPTGLTISNLVNPEFAEAIDLKRYLYQEPAISSSLPAARKEHWKSLTHGILAFILEQLDRCAAAYSLEVRHPFMDKRLIEFCLALPAEQKLHQGWSRMIVRRALADVLPESVQWRGGKADMTANFLHGLLVRDRSTLDEVMQNHLEPLQPYINLDVLNQAYQRLTTDQRRREDNLIVWRSVVLALWLQRQTSSN